MSWKSSVHCRNLLAFQCGVVVAPQCEWGLRGNEVQFQEELSF